jgi:hypothetical protein
MGRWRSAACGDQFPDPAITGDAIPPPPAQRAGIAPEQLFQARPARRMARRCARVVGES